MENKGEKELINIRLQKLDNLRKKGINPYAYSFNQKNYAAEILEENKKLKKEGKSSKKVSIAGRIMTIRRMGKAGFAHIQDSSGKIQIYVRIDDVGKDIFKLFEKSDLGDIVGVEGTIFRTKMGEVTINVKKFEVLTKNIKPLPEKWHGLKDIEERYRKRYLDLIMNPDVKEVFIKRQNILEAMREFMRNNKFIEIETPLLQQTYGGAYAKPFKTHCDALNNDIYLSIAPELFLKKALVGGFDRVYEITKKFRNEGMDKSHNPEHMTIEWYQAYADYEDGMKLFEELMKFIAKKVLGKLIFEYQGNKINLSKWQKISLQDAIRKYLKEDISKIKTDDQARAVAKKHGLEPKGITRISLPDELIKLFREKLIQPTFLIDYPIELAPLAKPKKNDPTKAEIFQPFIGGIELAKAYSELNDPKIQEANFKEQEQERKRGNAEAMPTDNDFVTSLEYGMPPACGVGIGIERVVMLFTNSTSIRDVLLFPFMKYKEGDKK